jgi:hypothetical protein
VTVIVSSGLEELRPAMPAVDAIAVPFRFAVLCRRLRVLFYCFIAVAVSVC